MTVTEYESEIARLHAFILQLAMRLAAASDVLSNLAERKRKRPNPSDGNEADHVPAQ